MITLYVLRERPDNEFWTVKGMISEQRFSFAMCLNDWSEFRIRTS